MNGKSVFSIATAVVLLAPLAWADDAIKDAVEHPVTAYDDHAVKSDEKDQMKYSQEVKEKKALRDQAKKDYEKALSQNGAENSVTKDAKSRYNSAEKDYMKLAKKEHKALQDLKQDSGKLQEDKVTQ